MKGYVYTASFGDGYGLPFVHRVERGVDYFAVVDDDSKLFHPWEPCLSDWEGQCPTKYNRFIKHRGLATKDKYDWSLYIDSNVEILRGVKKFIEAWLNDGTIALFIHPDRDNPVDELDECLDLGKIDEETYRRVYPEALKTDPMLWQASVIMRRRDDEVCGQWWGDMMRLSCYRDQPILPITLKRTGLTVATVYEDIRDNAWFGWGRWREGRRLTREEIETRRRMA